MAAASFKEVDLSAKRLHVREDDRSAQASLRRLAYRYLWPFAHFRDVSRGLRMERQQNYRYNRARRALLPGYALKWGAMTTLCYALALMPVPLALKVGLCVAGAWALVVCLLVLTAWLWLARFPELYGAGE